MKEPLFKPGQWVCYQKEDNGGGFGEIIGGHFDSNDWEYVVQHAALDLNTDAPDGTPIDAVVRTDEIKFIYEGDNWMAPSKTLGGNSVYVYTDA